MRITRVHQNPYLAAKLVYIYSTCGSIVDAWVAFDEASERTMFMWNALLRAYVKNGFCETKAMEIYNQMKLSGMKLDNFTFSIMLKACGSLMDLQQGMEIHGQVIKTGYELDVFVGGALVDMYCRCCSVEDANQVFEEMRHRDVVTWIAMIARVVHNGFPGEALECFRQIHVKEHKSNSTIVASVLSACGSLEALQKGKEIHGYIAKGKLNSNVAVQTAVMDMYSKCGFVEDANKVFDKDCEGDVIACSIIIVGNGQKGHVTKAFEIFRQMLKNSVIPNVITIVNFLLICGDSSTLQQVWRPHTKYLMKALIRVLDVVTWTTMIVGLVNNEFHGEALESFQQINVEENEPNSAIVASVLSACGSLAALQKGKKIHGYIVRGKLDSNVVVWTFVMDMYSKCGSVEDVNKVFDKYCEGHVIACSIIIVGNGQKGHVTKAFEIFRQMLKNSVMSNVVTVVNVLLICGDSATLHQGKELHAYGIKCGFVTIVCLRSAFINMYAK
eukprot:PITA_26437